MKSGGGGKTALRRVFLTYEKHLSLVGRELEILKRDGDQHTQEYKDLERELVRIQTKRKSECKKISCLYMYQFLLLCCLISK